MMRVEVDGGGAGTVGGGAVAVGGGAVAVGSGSGAVADDCLLHALASRPSVILMPTATSLFVFVVKIRRLLAQYSTTDDRVAQLI